MKRRCKYCEAEFEVRRPNNYLTCPMHRYQHNRPTKEIQRGVIVYYIDAGQPDHYSKKRFLEYIQAGLRNCGFKAGDRYVIGGEEYRI